MQQKTIENSQNIVKRYQSKTVGFEEKKKK